MGKRKPGEAVEPGTGDPAPAQRLRKPKEQRLDASGKVVRRVENPSLKTMKRLARCLPGTGHRLFLLGRKVVEAAPGGGIAREEFSLLDTAGKACTVTVGRQPGCTCRDSVKNVCRHSLFVMTRVLALPHFNPLVWQRGLLAGEVEDVYAESDERLAADGLEGGCSICCELMDVAAEGAAVDAQARCGACGCSTHSPCFQRWSKAKADEGEAASCPLCRAPWEDGAGSTTPTSPPSVPRTLARPPSRTSAGRGG